MFCEKCGKQFDDTDKYCPFCGAQYSEDPANDPQQSASYFPPQQTQGAYHATSMQRPPTGYTSQAGTPVQKKRLSTSALIVIMVSAAAVLGLLVFFGLRLFSGGSERGASDANSVRGVWQGLLSFNEWFPEEGTGSALVYASGDGNLPCVLNISESGEAAELVIDDVTIPLTVESAAESSEEEAVLQLHGNMGTEQIVLNATRNDGDTPKLIGDGNVTAGNETVAFTLDLSKLSDEVPAFVGAVGTLPAPPTRDTEVTADDPSPTQEEEQNPEQPDDVEEVVDDTPADVAASVSDEPITLTLLSSAFKGTYSGEVDADGLPDGSGEFIEEDTDEGGSLRYEGMWEHGHFCGEGFLDMGNGWTQRGTFKDDHLNGQGTMERNGLPYYEGEWLDGEFHGTGTLYTQTGTLLYAGAFEHNQRKESQADHESRAAAFMEECDEMSASYAPWEDGDDISGTAVAFWGDVIAMGEQGNTGLVVVALQGKEDRPIALNYRYGVEEQRLTSGTKSLSVWGYCVGTYNYTLNGTSNSAPLIEVVYWTTE